MGNSALPWRYDDAAADHTLQSANLRDDLAARPLAAGLSMRAVNDFVSEAGASDLGWFLER